MHDGSRQLQLEARAGPATGLLKHCYQAAHGIQVSQQAGVQASMLRDIRVMIRTWSAGKKRDSMRAGFS